MADPARHARSPISLRLVRLFMAAVANRYIKEKPGVRADVDHWLNQWVRDDRMKEPIGFTWPNSKTRWWCREGDILYLSPTFWLWPNALDWLRAILRAGDSRIGQWYDYDPQFSERFSESMRRMIMRSISNSAKMSAY